MTTRFSLVILATMFVAQPATAQRQPPPKPASSEEKQTVAPPDSDPERVSDAERISRLQRGIDETQSKLGELKDKHNDPKSEYKKAETEFGELDSQFEDGRKELHKLKGDGALGLDERESALADLDKKRTLARERFDLAIRERKAIQDQMILLEQKLQQDRDALNKLLGVAEAKPQPAVESRESGATAPGTPPTTTEKSVGKQGTVPSGEPVAQPTAVPTATDLANPLAVPPPAIDPNAPAEAKAPPSEKIVKAQETATSKQAEAEEAKQQAQSITERLDSIRKVIESERELRRNGRQKAANARESLAALNDEHAKKWNEGKGLAYGSPELVDLRKAIADAEKRVGEADAEILERGEILDARHTELAALQAEQIVALEQAKKKMEEAEAARAELAHLENPFAPANIWLWIVTHGPKIGITLLAAIIMLWLIQVMEHRMVRLFTRRGVAGTSEERESRARTLVGVLQNLVTLIVVVGALFIVAAESGFNIFGLLGATAVIGLAVAFGAQNLIRDYFYGFMILMENQYLVNDVVRLGAVSGQVERITLRITVLRDLRGTVHFVPHGQITTVSNLTRGWARVVLDVGVAYKEDVNRVMKVLAELGKEMRRDPAYRDLILDEPEISGVDALSDSAVVVRFLIKTRPLKQWLVKREMLRRIKNKFDEVGIEIPFPHQVVFNRFDANRQEQARLIAPTRPDEKEEWTTPHSATSPDL